MSSLGIDRNAIWPSLGYTPHQGQQRIHRSKARHRVGTAGRRAGKSQIGGHELVPEALYAYTVAELLLSEGKRREFWIVGPEYSDSEKEFRVLWNDLERLEVPFDHPGSYNAPWNGEMSISLWGGAYQVHAKSAKYPGTLVGEGLAGVVMAEAAKLKPAVWFKYVRPTLADLRGWSLWLSTPEGKNWYFDIHQRGQDPNETQWASWRMPSYVNTFVFPKGGSREGVELLLEARKNPELALTPELIAASGVDDEIADMMKDMTEERFNQEIMADFSEFVGRVFKDFDEEIHVTDLAYNRDLPLYLAVDYGWTNPTVVLFIQIDVWSNVYVIAEYRRTRTDITDIAKELESWRGGLAMRATHIYADPASPGDTNVLVNRLRLRSVGGTGGALRDRLLLIREALKLRPEHAPWEDRKPMLWFDRSCKEANYEMGAYRYPDTASEKTEAPELPLKKDDHAPEALGRFYAGHFVDVEDAGRPVVTTARVG